MISSLSTVLYQNITATINISSQHFYSVNNNNLHFDKCKTLSILYIILYFCISVVNTLFIVSLLLLLSNTILKYKSFTATVFSLPNSEENND